MSDALVQLFAESLEIDPTELNDDSSPENLKQWDSLAAMKLVLMTSQEAIVATEMKQNERSTH